MTAKKFCNYVWLNGEIIPWEESLIPVSAHSLHYAGSVFEGQRAYNGRIFKLAEHTQRLINSAQLIGLSVPYSAAQIEQANIDILDKNQLKNAYIRPVIWRGGESLKIYDEALQSNLAIFVSESNPAFKNPMSLFLSPWRKPSADIMPVQSKSAAHYAMLSMSQKMAKDQGFDDALLLDTEGNIAEISSANIFFVAYEAGHVLEIVTPIADRFLNGVTRQTIIELAKIAGYKLVEKRLKLEELPNYQTCFVTGTSVELCAVSLIDIGKNQLKFEQLEIVEELQNLYAELVGKVVDEEINE